MSGDWRGTLWTLLVTFCIVIIRDFWSPCIWSFKLVGILCWCAWIPQRPCQGDRFVTTVVSGWHVDKWASEQHVVWSCVVCAVDAAGRIFVWLATEQTVADAWLSSSSSSSLSSTTFLPTPITRNHFPRFIWHVLRLSPNLVPTSSLTGAWWYS
jgi:hypothetical protein